MATSLFFELTLISIQRPAMFCAPPTPAFTTFTIYMTRVNIRTYTTTLNHYHVTRWSVINAMTYIYIYVIISSNFLISRQLRLNKAIINMTNTFIKTFPHLIPGNIAYVLNTNYVSRRHQASTRPSV